MFEGKFTGRVDSLTAPELLKLWEDQTGPISAARVDCSELSYLSSAGLRVLTLIQKSLSEGTLVLTDVSREVGEVLSMTGLDTIIEVQLAK